MENLNEYEAECMRMYGRTTVSVREFNLSFDSNVGTYEQDILQEEMMNFYLRNDMGFRRAFSTDYTNHFFKFLQDKARLREVTHLSTMGVTRSGKSYGMLSVQAFYMGLFGKLITPMFICANAFKFLQRIQQMDLNLTKDTMFLRDEDKDAVFGTGSIAKRAKLQDVANIIAKHNISTLSLCPIKFAAQEESHYGLRAFGKNRTNGTNRYMLYNLQESKTTTKPMGLVYIPIFTKMLPDWYAKPLEEAYNKLKDEWIEREIKGESDVLAELKRGQARNLFKDPVYLELKKKDERFAYATQKLGSEWAKMEVLEIMALVEILKRGVILS